MMRLPTSRQVLLRSSLPCAIILAIIIICAVYGVSPSTTLIYLGYELLYIGIPGCLTVLALTGREWGLRRTVVTGWPVGYLIEIIAVIVASSLGIRWLLMAYPIVVVALCAPIVIRRYRAVPYQATSGPLNLHWQISIVIILVLVNVAAFLFEQTPLPGTVAEAFYDKDLVWSLSLSAEAKRHWPIMDPCVAGERLPYHYFCYMHIGAASNITGIDLSLVFLRLYLLPLFVLLCLQLYTIGKDHYGSSTGGVLTAVLVLLMGEIDPFRSLDFPFAGYFLSDTYYGLSLLFGMIFFVPIIGLIAEMLDTRSLRTTSPGRWLLMILLIAGAAGAKGAIMPVVIGGLILLLVWDLVRRRQLNRNVLLSLLLAAGILGTFLLTLYRGLANQLILSPFAVMHNMQLLQQWLHVIPDTIVIRVPLVAALYLIGFLGMGGMVMIGLVGVAVHGYYNGLDRSRLWYLMLFIAGCIPFFLLEMPGENQLYFYFYGYIAAAIAAAPGLQWIAHRVFRSSAALRLGIGIPLASILVICIMDFPVDNRKAIKKAIRREYINRGTQGLTAGEYRGLLWLRDHSPEHAVVAVNNQFLDHGHDPRYYYYSAFSERRVFLEGWGSSNASIRLGWQAVLQGDTMPFPDHLALNTGVFEAGDQACLQRMQRIYGVTHLIIDKHYGQGSAIPLSSGQRVFSNADMDIIELAGR